MWSEREPCLIKVSRRQLSGWQLLEPLAVGREDRHAHVISRYQARQGLHNLLTSEVPAPLLVPPVAAADGVLPATENTGTGAHWRYAGATKAPNTFDADRMSSSDLPTLSYFRNRVYDQETGRWTQEDPIGVAGGLNLYQFNGNNPVLYTDPFGLCPPYPCRDPQQELIMRVADGVRLLSQPPLVVGVSGTIGNLSVGVTTGAVEGGGAGISANSPSAGASVDIGVKYRTASPGEPTGSVSAGVGKHTGVTVTNETIMVNIGVSTPTASPITITKDIEPVSQGAMPIPIVAKPDATRVCTLSCR
jgi:RHS repeat-associated protein